MKGATKSTKASSSSSRISSAQLRNLLTESKYNKHCESTKGNHHKIWQLFNKFVIRLDYIPETWEERVCLFCVHMIYTKGSQSATIKSYVSAIKSKLIADDYDWNDKLVLLNTLSGACRLRNDKLRTRLPIKRHLLEILIRKLEDKFHSQPYLKLLYRTMFTIAYYGLFRIGELTMSQHVMKAKDVHINRKKNKILLVLFSSKTHSSANRPQRVIINTVGTTGKNVCCPFRSTLLNDYLTQRGGYDNSREPLFIFRDGTPVTSVNFRSVLKDLLKGLQLNHKLYAPHSFRIG